MQQWEGTQWEGRHWVGASHQGVQHLFQVPFGKEKRQKYRFPLKQEYFQGGQNNWCHNKEWKLPVKRAFFFFCICA